MIPGRSLLRGRDFRLVAGAVGLSALGDWVAIVALGLHVKEVTDSGLEVAVLWVCLFGPSVVVAGQAGLLVDRIETTRLLAGVSLVGAVVAAVVSFTTGTVALVALTALLGLVFAILQPAEFALVPRLAGNRVLEANGHVETARYMGFGLGPLLGGLLYAAGGLEPAMLSMPRHSWRSPAQRLHCGYSATRGPSRRPSARHAPAMGSPSCSATGCCGG